MSIKANLFYDRSKDYVIGLAINDSRQKHFKPSLTVCVFMLRGLFQKWKQPLVYFFVHTSCPAESLNRNLNVAVEKVSSIGLHVCGVTSDMGSNNLKLAKLLHIQHLFFIFDVPHVIKALRNMLLTLDFYYNGKRISWQYIRDFYNLDKNFPVKATHKLTDSHIKPTNFEKMKVKLATQVFSNSVYVGMTFYMAFNRLPVVATETAKCIERVDKLFDILNSAETLASKKYNAAFKNEEFQNHFLTDCLLFLEKLEIRDKCNINITNKIKFINSLKVSINSTLGLFQYLKTNAGFDYLFTKKLNQDCLENHFGQIRRANANCVNPSPVQFQRTFRKLQLY